MSFHRERRDVILADRQIRSVSVFVALICANHNNKNPKKRPVKQRVLFDMPILEFQQVEPQDNEQEE